MASLRTDAKDLLREMVALPSVHPEADSGGTKPGEAAMAAWTANYLRRLGADVRIAPLSPDRPSVIGVFEPARPSTTIAFAPHLDTVGVGNMAVPPFQLTRRRGRLHGRGACDTKGPAAALLAALTRWVKSPARRATRTRWMVVATAGEEQGSLGAQALVKTGLAADFLVALEPTDLRVVYAAKGVLRVWIEVPGRAAHGANPERGLNAVYQSLPLLHALRDDLTARLARQRHDVLGGCSLNLGIMHGGRELNIVPSLCRLGLDIRHHPGFPAAAVLSALRRLVARHAPSATLRVHRTGPAFVTGQSSPFVKALRKAGRGWAVADWFCDANVFSASGIPSVAFGPGKIAQAHTKDEFILERELAAGTAAFSRFLSSGT
jgi:acetylornithine deacetylase/succinyl-diaminopimelate desuccinylase-like protein